MRFELTRRNRHYPLKVACLPIPPPGQKKLTGENCQFKGRAKNGTRTRDPNLGKVVLYQLSYFRNNKHQPKNIVSFLDCDAKVQLILINTNLCVVFLCFFYLFRFTTFCSYSQNNRTLSISPTYHPLSKASKKDARFH